MVASNLPLTRKEMLWLSCAEKKCCSNVILVSGRDVWRISRILDTPPASFAVYFPTPVATRDAFRMDDSDQLYRLALAKKPSRRRPELAPCTFLMRLSDGSHRCGLGELRPLVCRAYPSEILDGVVLLRGKTTCTCRHWALADVDIEEERALVSAREADGAEYWDLVERWNDHVLADPTGRRHSFGEYMDFLFAVYDERAMATG